MSNTHIRGAHWYDLGMMVVGGWKRKTPFSTRAVRSFAMASVYRVLPFSLSNSMASLVLRSIAIPKRSRTGVLTFFRIVGFPLDRLRVTVNLG